MTNYSISLAPLTVLDVSPANQVIVAAEPIYATIGNTAFIKQIKHNLQASCHTGSRY